MLARLGRLIRAHQFDVSLVTLILVLHVVGFGQSPDVGAAASLLAAVPIVALLFRRAAPVVVALTYLVATGLSMLLDLPDASSAATVVLVVAGAYSAGAYLSVPRGLATLALWWSAVLLDFISGREAGGASDFHFAGTPRPAGAVAAERARIARELHAVVAHAVSIMVVQAAAADEVLERDPMRAHAALAAVQQTGRSAVTEMARMLDLLRGTRPGDDLTPLPTLDALVDLAAET